MEISEEQVKKIESTIAGTLDLITTQKKRQKKLSKIWGCVGIVAGGICGAMIVSNTNYAPFLNWLIVGGSALVGYFLFGFVVEFKFYIRHTTLYKKEVMPVLVKTLLPGATYSPEGFITKREVKFSNVFQVGGRHNFYSEDGITGRIGRTEFTFSEIKITEETHVVNQGSETVFRGFALKADFNKHFEGRTFVYHKKLTISRGTTWFSNFKKCELEDDNFMKRYQCYTTNDQEARNLLLTPKLRQSIIDLEDKLKANVSVAFYDDQMLLLVDDGRNHFELKDDMKDIMKDMEAIVQMVGIVEQFNQD